MELYNLKLKKLLIFQNIRSQKSNQEFFYISFLIFCLENCLREFFKHKRKRKKFPLLSLIKKQNVLN